MRLFLGHSASLVKELARASASADSSALEPLAHSLAGSSSTFGAGVLAARCRALRAAAVAGESHRVADLVAEIEAEFAAVHRSLCAEIGDTSLARG